MVWTEVQRNRLAIEKETLEKYFRHGVTWIDPQHETKVDVVLISNPGKAYTLRVYIPADFPNSCPVLVVVSPQRLYLKNGSELPEMSVPFHTLEDTFGFHRVCHFYPPDWTPDITLYQVFMKGRLWIEAYEAHLETGNDMDVYLAEQEQIRDSDDNYHNNSVSEWPLDPDISENDASYTGRVLENNSDLPAQQQDNATLSSVLPLQQHFPNDALYYTGTSPNNNSTGNSNNATSNSEHSSNNRSPILSSPLSNDASPEQTTQQNIGFVSNQALLPDQSSGVHQTNLPVGQCSEPLAHTRLPNSDSSSSLPRIPAGGVRLPFHEEMVRRNSSSNSRPRPNVVPPPVKPKPKRR